MSAEERLQDYQDDMSVYLAILGELNKIDMASLDVAEKQTHRQSLKTGIKALRGLIADVKYEVETTGEKIAGIQESVRFARQKQEAYEQREYRESQ